MQSIIILGQIDKTREKTTEILITNKISKFDAQTFTSEKTIGIPDIRNLQKNIFLKPLRSDKKAVILDAFLGITVDAQNAFLKILEEPPASTIILILVVSLDFILPTVLSRCTLIDLSRTKEFSKEINQEYLTLLQSIIEGKENPLVVAQNNSKDRETALQFLENLIIAAENNINNNYRLGSTLKKLQKTYTVIKSTNVNIRFSLENLFLNL